MALRKREGQQVRFDDTPALPSYSSAAGGAAMEENLQYHQTPRTEHWQLVELDFHCVSDSVHARVPCLAVLAC